jgi:L-lactate permease
MFQAEINDANTASVVSGALGIPISKLAPGTKSLVGNPVVLNQTQLNKLQPNITSFVSTID